jgi:hypothetical protein
MRDPEAACCRRMGPFRLGLDISGNAPCSSGMEGKSQFRPREV